MKIDQFVPGLCVGDAVTNHALEIQKALRELGHESAIYSEWHHVSPHMKPACLDYSDYVAGREQVLFYHFSTGSKLTPLFQAAPSKKVMIYHNITPERFFQGLSEEKAQSVRAGREQLKNLNSTADLALGVSEYNRKELDEAGFAHTGVLPLVFDPYSWNGHVNSKLLNKYRDGKTNFLFVGRVVPNKRFEDVIRAFYMYQKTVNPNSRLLLIGSYTGMEKYYAFLKALVNRLDVKDVVFSGHVSDEDLKTYYHCGDLFLCMSEHEGFCIPILEAIHTGMPVFAFSSSALPETLGGRGVLINEKNYLEIAEMAGKILADSSLKNKIISAQKERLTPFSREKLKERLKQILENQNK